MRITIRKASQLMVSCLSSSLLFSLRAAIFPSGKKVCFLALNTTYWRNGTAFSIYRALGTTSPRLHKGHRREEREGHLTGQ